MGDNESGHSGHEADGDHHPEIGAGHEPPEEWTGTGHVDFDENGSVAEHIVDDADGVDSYGFDGPDAALGDDIESAQPDDLEDSYDDGVVDVYLEAETVGLVPTDLLDAVLERVPGLDAESFASGVAEAMANDDDLGLGLDSRAVNRLLDTSGVESIIEYGTTDHIVQRVDSGQVVLVGGTETQWTVTRIDGGVLELIDDAGRSRTIERQAFDELWDQSTMEIIEIRADADADGPIRFGDVRLAVLPMTINE